MISEQPRWGGRRELSDYDAFVWRADRHPELSNCVALVGLLDGTPDWELLRRLTTEALNTVPRLRDRIDEPPLPLVTPVWVPAEDFDLDYHLYRARLAGPGDQAELLRFARRFALTPLDHRRPLWEACLVDGLPDGRSALVVKIHHALTDGSGFVQLLQLLQAVRLPRGIDDGDPPRPVSRGGGPALTPQRLIAETGHLAVGAAGSIGALARHNPIRQARDAVSLGQSLLRSLPPPATPSPLWRGRTGRAWEFGVLECELAQLKAAGKAGGGTVNDAFLTALLDGVGRYHDLLGAPVPEIPVMVPVNRRSDTADPGGNHMTAGFIAGPTTSMEPAVRMRLINDAMRSARSETALGAVTAVAPLLSRIPSALGTTALRTLGGRADLGASNVRGLPDAGRIAGVPMTHLFAFGTLTGTAVLVTMLSHGSRCCIGINCDATVVTDSQALVDCMQKGLDHVLALA